MLLHLKSHCIQTAAKQKRKRIASALLELHESSEGFKQLADDLELVTSFLENTDFRKTRAERPELAGGCDIHVELMLDADPGQFVLTVVRRGGADTQ